ncbi:hypothetical protein [Herpetosiphon geysericola]|uniref:Uncharacterized protein n=1 Tax=Herpetosiphon geysericola TaxID=70996 RepID=A0A0P6YKZ8_9CHLR|nr:hypothetical protein [Herpetosiphon geysericola]KPL90539.1 hypothetical protein SE18_05455 [Herpetosiphon geysericola]
MYLVVGGILLIIGFYPIMWLLLRATIKQAKKQPSNNASFQILSLNLAEPFISTGLFLPMLLVSPNHPFFNWLNRPNKVNGTVLFGLYHWPMLIMLGILPLFCLYTKDRLVIKTALASWLIGGIRLLAMWAIYQFSLMWVIALIIGSIWSFSLLGIYLDYLVNQLAKPNALTPTLDQ